MKKIILIITALIIGYMIINSIYTSGKNIIEKHNQDIDNIIKGV